MLYITTPVERWRRQPVVVCRQWAEIPTTPPLLLAGSNGGKRRMLFQGWLGDTEEVEGTGMKHVYRFISPPPSHEKRIIITKRIVSSVASTFPPSPLSLSVSFYRGQIYRFSHLSFFLLLLLPLIEVDARDKFLLVKVFHQFLSTHLLPPF